MNDVINMQERRASRTKAACMPKRAPDAYCDIWIKDGRVDWICTNFGDDRKTDEIGEDEHRQRILLLLDAAFTYGETEDKSRGSRLVMLHWLHQDGHELRQFARSLFEGTSWPHARWLLRRWIASSKWWLRSAWRALRGRG